jgi:hypothetical protein
MANTGDFRNGNPFMISRPVLDSAQRRLMFWLWTPYLSDAALVALGWWLVAGGNTAGWWAIAFAGVRAILGTASIMLARRKFASERNPRN